MRSTRKGDGKPMSKGKAKRGAVAVGTILLAGSVLAYGATASCSSDAPSEDAGQEAFEEASKASPRTHGEHYYGEENWSFMSDETLATFEDAFYTWLLEGGHENGSFVYLHSEDISCTDGIWSAYARTPQDNAYFKVTFDAASKELSFEEVSEPDFAKRAHAEREEATAPDEEVASQDMQGTSDRRDASRNVALDDASGLARLLPAKAASSLPDIAIRYARDKGIATAPALCSVYPSSVHASGDTTTFELLVYDEQKSAYLVRADYSGEKDAFGFALEQL